MGKKLLALAVIGAAAAFLLKTEKGKEISKNLAKKADGLKDKIIKMYESKMDGMAEELA
jgi:gas vesicle protein